MSLRERKKLAAREALSWAAVRLATERGLEHVRVDEIAAEVGVSPRTFNNYFSSKEEAICAIGVDRQTRIREALLARPASEPLWDAVINAVLERYSAHGEPDRDYVTRVRLMVSDSSLRGEYLKSHAMVECVLAHAIAERRIHHAMALDARFAFESATHHQRLEMLAIAVDFEPLAFQARIDCALQLLGGRQIGAHR